MKFIFILILLFNIISCNQIKEDTSVNNEPVKIDSLSPPFIQEKKVDTVYTTHYKEEPLKNGYQFGMKLSEWNTLLASLAKQGELKELDQINCLEDLKKNPNYAVGSLKGFDYFDDLQTSDEMRLGCYVIGLFVKPEVSENKVEIFKIGNELVTEPILIGIETVFKIPNNSIPTLLDYMIINDRLVYLAGPKPMYPTNNYLALSDFQDPMDENFGNLNKSLGNAPLPKSGYISNESSTNTLYNSDYFYALIQVKEIRHAFVYRDDDNKVIDFKDAYRDYNLTHRIYSKKQFTINPRDYMTEAQKINYDNDLKTKNLIDENIGSNNNN
jgi:hypothetical protein